ncbi:MAG: hypothetical protein HY859_02485 [Caulobacterales bacterium]|nr:hypothetical protein [Caulobacterales bacterium]
MTFLVLALMVAMTPAGIMAAETAPQPSTTPVPLLIADGQRVVFLGDSITGAGWSEPGGYVRLVVSGLGTLGVKITPLPAGVGGNTSDDMLKRLDKDVLSKRPDWMLLSCGVNDVWSRKIDLETFKSNITAIVDQAHAAGIHVMLLTPTPIYETVQSEFSRLADYAAWMIRFAEERKIPLADEHAAFQAYFKTQPPDKTHRILTMDGVHANPDGQQVLARCVLATIGVTEAQSAKITETWAAAPDGATISAHINIYASAPVVQAQKDMLEHLAQQHRQELPIFLRGVLMAATRDAMVAQGDLATVDDDGIRRMITPIFRQKIALLAPVVQGATVATPTVEVAAKFQFRAMTTVSIPQYERLKKVARARQSTSEQVVLGIFLNSVRDALKTYEDVRDMHEDHISAKGAPLFKEAINGLIAQALPSLP